MKVPAFLLVLATAVAVSVACRPELVRPCTCLYNGLKCFNISEMATLQAVFDKSVGNPYVSFFLMESTVMYIKASWLTANKIQRIHVSDSKMKALFDHVPGVDNQVTLVQLQKVRFHRGIQWKQFKPLKKLTCLVIQDIELRRIDNSLGENVSPTLLALRLKGTNTKLLGERALHTFTHLQKFELQDAQLSTLKRSMFANPSELRFLDLRNNRINSLPNDIFSNMEQLRDVHLNGNKFVTLPARVFKNAYENSFFRFHVQDNPLKCDCSISWLVFSEAKVNVQGACSAPANLKDRKLSDLKQEEFSKCPH